jgi:hypothetical protein
MPYDCHSPFGGGQVVKDWLEMYPKGATVCGHAIKGAGGKRRVLLEEGDDDDEDEKGEEREDDGFTVQEVERPTFPIYLGLKVRLGPCDAPKGPRWMHTVRTQSITSIQVRSPNL